MAKTENKLERVFHRAVREAGGRSFKITSPTRGVPDRLVIWPGGGLELVELKTVTGRLSEIQKLWHKRAAELGCHVTLLRGESEIWEWAGKHQSVLRLADIGTLELEGLL